MEDRIKRLEDQNGMLIELVKGISDKIDGNKVNKRPSKRKPAAGKRKSLNAPIDNGNLINQSALSLPSDFNSESGESAIIRRVGSKSSSQL